MLRYLDAMLTIAPEGARGCLMRAILRWQSGQREGAIEDADWLLAHQPDDVDLGRVRDLRAILDRTGN